ncbi:MAG: hypothetical protein GQ534_01795 [Candidatus Delongbacteria bacterium]|nr:hypothetical protein [Candidatus Delongbacteria bacterium]
MFKLYKLLILIIIVSGSFFQLVYSNEDSQKPFILGSIEKGSMKKVEKIVRKKLANNGFEIIGEHSSLSNVKVIIITNKFLKNSASESFYGGFGSFQRVYLSKDGNRVKVIYNNPIYTFHAYQMSGTLEPVLKDLKKALGMEKSFGSEKGIEIDKLESYHLDHIPGEDMMPFFDDFYELATFDSYAEAVEVVENAIKSNKGFAQNIFRIDIPNKDETVFGITYNKDKNICKEILDTFGTKSNVCAAVLPYEILVTDNEVIAMHAKFRIPLNFHDIFNGNEANLNKLEGFSFDIEKFLKILSTAK